MCRINYYLIAVLSIALLLVSGGCGDDDDDATLPPIDGFDRTEMLENIGINIIVPAYNALQNETGDLQQAANAFADNQSVQNLQNLQDALKSARLAWQDANLFQFGPAESINLRSSLNTYPTDVDRIEENISSGSYVLGSLADIAAGGFPALGYLLHGSEKTDDEIVTDFTEAANAQNRMQYLMDNVDFIQSRVETTVNGWSSTGDDFIGTFLSEDNAGTDVGSSVGLLLNAFILHYERFLRDGKIGIPAGIRSAGIPRPTATEAFYSGYSAELAVANLEAVERFFQGIGLNGIEGLGLADYLTSQNAEDLSATIMVELSDATDQTEQLVDPLSAFIESNPETVNNAFVDIQEVVVLFKVDMTSILGVTITFQDNDGD